MVFWGSLTLAKLHQSNIIIICQAGNETSMAYMRKCVCWAWSCIESKQAQRSQSQFNISSLSSYRDSFAIQREKNYVKWFNNGTLWLCISLRTRSGSLIWKLLDKRRSTEEAAWKILIETDCAVFCGWWKAKVMDCAIIDHKNCRCQNLHGVSLETLINIWSNFLRFQKLFLNLKIILLRINFRASN